MANARNIRPTSIFDSVKKSPTIIFDSGQVRIGNASPPFPMMRPLVRGRPLTVSDTGEVQVGDYGAARNSGSTADEPNVRIAAVGRSK
jgi:hypothetical protein